MMPVLSEAPNYVNYYLNKHKLESILHSYPHLARELSYLSSTNSRPDASPSHVSSSHPPTLPANNSPLRASLYPLSSHYRNITSPEKYVGFADLPNQIYRQSVLQGFDFNLMVVGESGLGKSTFINNLFTADIYQPSLYSEKIPPISYQTMEVRSSTVTITENGVPLRLTLIDTPGFGDCINNSTCWEKILSFVNKKHDEYMQWESSPSRTPIKDMRVHCCLYFICPTGHRLKPLDLDFLKRLHDKVNIIPVIAKADTLSIEDLTFFKKRIMDDLKINSIRTYDFPDISPKDDEERDTVKSYINRIPFGLVSSNAVMEIDGKPVRCRKYPWGICEVDNLDHCDFVALRNLLLRTCVCHLIETTHTVLYERYRANILADASGTCIDGSPFEVIEAEKVKQTSRLEGAKQEVQGMYKRQEEEFRKRLEEKEKTFVARVAEEEAELSKQHISDGTPVNASQHSDLGKCVGRGGDVPTEDPLKKKDRKKKIF